MLVNLDKCYDSNTLFFSLGRRALVAMSDKLNPASKPSKLSQTWLLLLHVTSVLKYIHTSTSPNYYSQHTITNYFIVITTITININYVVILYLICINVKGVAEFWKHSRVHYLTCSIDRL